MLDHRVPRYLGSVSDDLQFPVLDPLGHVVILSSPAPEHVGESVQSPELIGPDSGDSSEYLFVRQLVLELVHGHGHVAGVVRTVVQVPVVLGQEINVVEDEAVPGEIFHRLRVAHVEEHGSVELVLVCLVDDVNPVVEFLFPQEGMEMSEENQQLFRSVSVRDDDGNIEIGLTGLWTGLSSWLEIPVLTFHLQIRRN